MTPSTRAELRALLAKATKQSGSAHWICGAEREDGTAQVYSPSRGLLRVVVPVAETSAVCGAFIAACSPKVIAELFDALDEAESRSETQRDDRIDAIRARQRAALRKS